MSDVNVFFESDRTGFAIVCKCYDEYINYGKLPAAVRFFQDVALKLVFVPDTGQLLYLQATGLNEEEFVRYTASEELTKLWHTMKTEVAPEIWEQRIKRGNNG